MPSSDKSRRKGVRESAPSSPAYGLADLLAQGWRHDTSEWPAVEISDPWHGPNASVGSARFVPLTPAIVLGFELSQALVPESQSETIEALRHENAELRRKCDLLQFQRLPNDSSPMQAGATLDALGSAMLGRLASMAEQRVPGSTVSRVKDDSPEDRGVLVFEVAFDNTAENRKAVRALAREFVNQCEVPVSIRPQPT